MQLEDMKAVKPREYLSEGFVGEDGRVRERLNGYYSLGMAWRLRQEGVGPERVRALVEGLVRYAEARMPKAAERPLGEEERRELEKAWPAGEGGALGELREAAVPRVTAWKQFSAALLHLQRIEQQLALLQAGAGPRA